MKKMLRLRLYFAFLLAMLTLVSACGALTCLKGFSSNHYVPPETSGFGLVANFDGGLGEVSFLPDAFAATDQKYGDLVRFTADSTECDTLAIDLTLRFNKDDSELEAVDLRYGTVGCPGFAPPRTAWVTETDSVEMSCNPIFIWSEETLSFSVTFDDCVITITRENRQDPTATELQVDDGPKIRSIIINGSHTFEMQRSLCL